MATYYTKHNAAGGGDGSYANPWTLQEAADNATDGDEVRICNTGTYSISAAIDFDTNNGSRTSMISFVGYSSDGSSGPEMATVVQNTSSAHGFNISGKSWLYFENVSIQGGGGNVNAWQVTSNADHVTFVNCRGHSAGYHGWNLWNIDNSAFVKCEAYSNSRNGFYANGDVARRTTLIGCVAHDNTWNGVCFNRCDFLAYRCLAYDNSARGILVAENTADVAGRIIGCTVVGNGGTGIHVTANSGAELLVANGILSSNGNYGLSSDTASTNIVAFANLIPSSGDDANSNGATNNVTILGNPADVLKANLTGSQVADFLDDTLCNPDFRLGNDSDALSAGWPGDMPIENMCE